jgi:hypothetical protein
VARLNIRLPDDLKNQAQDEADIRGEKLAEFVRESIVFYLAWLHAQRERKP